MPNVSSEEIRAGRENVIRVFEAIARRLPLGTTERWNGVAFVHTGMASATFNLAFALEIPSELEGVADRVQHILVEGGTPWLLMTTLAVLPSLAPLIERFHLHRRETLPAMVLDLSSALAPPSPPELEIRQATSREEIRMALRTGAGGFEAPLDTFDAWVNGLVSEGPSGPTRLYVGLVEGKPVCSSIGFLTPPTLGVYFVSTLPEFRRRGFGAAMTHRAALDGLREGCSRSILQASEMGRPVYEKMGYRRVEEYQLWSSSSKEEAVPSPPG